MPSNIFSLATKLEKELAPISKKNIKPLSKLLQSTNPAFDQELINTVRLMKSTVEDKYAQKTLPDKKQKFIQSCENFLLQAAEEIKKSVESNTQDNITNSPLYKISKDNLVQILGYLNKEELQTTARVSKFLKCLIYGEQKNTKNLTETAPTVPRDYTQLPRKKNWQLFKNSGESPVYLCIAEQLIIALGKTINIHNIYTGEILYSLETDKKINHLVLSLDNKHMIGSSNIGDIYVWETENWKEIKTAKLSDKVMKMITVPGNTLLTAYGYDYDVKFWNMDDWKCLEIKNFTKTSWSAIFNGEFIDISHVAAAKTINLTVVAYDENLFVLCGKKWEIHFPYRLKNKVTCVAFIKDNESAAEFVAGTSKGEIFKWQYNPVTHKCEEPTLLGQYKSEITSVTTNGEILVVGTKNGGIQLLSGKNWTNLKEKSDHSVKFMHFISIETFIVVSGKEVSLYHFLPKVAEKLQAEDAVEKDSKMEEDTVSSNLYMP